MKISINQLKIASVVFSMILISLLYNITFEYRIIRYSICLVSYFIFSYYCLRFSTISIKLTLIYVLIPPVLIDSSVLLFAPNLTLLRFPYATSFTLLGILLGYFVFLKQKLQILLLLITILLYIYLSNSIIIPAILKKVELQAYVQFIINDSIKLFLQKC